MDRYLVLLQFCFLHAQDVANIVWAAEGVKTVSSLTLYRRSVPRQDQYRLFDILDGYGLCVSCRKKTINAKNLYTFAALSLDGQKAVRGAQMECLCRNLNEKSRSIAYGRMFGYPETAVRGFAEKKMIKETEILPSFLAEEQCRLFLLYRPFRLSESHWRSEALRATEWIKTLKRAAPETNDCLVNRYLAKR